LLVEDINFYKGGCCVVFMSQGEAGVDAVRELVFPGIDGFLNEGEYGERRVTARFNRRGKFYVRASNLYDGSWEHHCSVSCREFYDALYWTSKDCEDFPGGRSVGIRFREEQNWGKVSVLGEILKGAPYLYLESAKAPDGIIWTNLDFDMPNNRAINVVRVHTDDFSEGIKLLDSFCISPECLRMAKFGLDVKKAGYEIVPGS
jgi:hypothetical protein